jgi:hypothetical protein
MSKSERPDGQAGGSRVTSDTAKAPARSAPAHATAAAPSPVATRQGVLLFAAVSVFALWTLFMAYLAVTSAQPIVVSRPQILVASIVIEADVPADGGDARTVEVIRVLRGQKLLGMPAEAEKPDELQITVSNFAKVRGWQGPGDYILALTRTEAAKGPVYELVPVPPSPGFPPRNHLERLDPAIYPVSASSRAQTQEALRLSEGR